MSDREFARRRIQSGTAAHSEGTEIFPPRRSQGRIRSLDVLDLNPIFRRQGKRHESCPFLDAWSFPAMRLAIQEAVLAHDRIYVPHEEHAWKLFFLLP